MNRKEDRPIIQPPPDGSPNHSFMGYLATSVYEMRLDLSEVKEWQVEHRTMHATLHKLAAVVFIPLALVVVAWFLGRFK